MHVQVLLLVRHLVEGQPTPGNRAQVGPLPSVDPQVVEQVVPLGEKLPAARVIARKGRRHAVRLKSQIANMAEETTRWDIALMLEEGLVQGLPRGAMHLVVGRDLEVEPRTVRQGLPGVVGDLLRSLVGGCDHHDPKVEFLGMQRGFNPLLLRWCDRFGIFQRRLASFLTSLEEPSFINFLGPWWRQVVSVLRALADLFFNYRI